MPVFVKQERSKGEARISDVTTSTSSLDPVDQKIEEDHRKSILKVSERP